MSIKDIQKAMLAKQAEQTGDNEDRLVSGEQQTYPEPEGHRDAAPADGIIHGTAVVREAASGRVEFLDRAFEELGSASAEDKAVINRNFNTPAGERRQAHSVLLEKKSSVHVRDGLTLKERVRSTLG